MFGEPREETSVPFEFLGSNTWKIPPGGLISLCRFRID